MNHETGAKTFEIDIPVLTARNRNRIGQIAGLVHERMPGMESEASNALLLRLVLEEEGHLPSLLNTGW